MGFGCRNMCGCGGYGYGGGYAGNLTACIALYF